MSPNFETSAIKIKDRDFRQDEVVALQRASWANTPAPTAINDFALRQIDESRRISERKTKSVKKNQDNVTKAYNTRSKAIRRPQKLRNTAQLALELCERFSVEAVTEPVVEPEPIQQPEPIVEHQPTPKLRLIVNKPAPPAPKLRLIFNKPIEESTPNPTPEITSDSTTEETPAPAPKLRLIFNKPVDESTPEPTSDTTSDSTAEQTSAPKLKLKLTVNKRMIKLRFRVNKPVQKLRLTFKNFAFFRSLLRQRAITGSVEPGILRTPHPQLEQTPRPATPSLEPRPISSCSPTTKLHLARSKINKAMRKKNRDCVPSPTNKPQIAKESQVDKALHEALQKRKIQRFNQTQEKRLSKTKEAAEELSELIKVCEKDPKSYKVALPAITPEHEAALKKKHAIISTCLGPFTKPAITREQGQWIRNYLPRDPSPLSERRMAGIGNKKGRLLKRNGQIKKRTIEFDPEEPVAESSSSPKRMRLWNDNIDITGLPY